MLVSNVFGIFIPNFGGRFSPILTVRIFFKWAGKKHHNSWGLIEAFPMTASWGWNIILQGNYTTGSSDAEVCVFQKREVSMYQGVLDSKVASVWESQLSVLRDKKKPGIFFLVRTDLERFGAIWVPRIPNHNSWSNYSDLTRPHPKWWFSKGNPLISGKSRLVKYYNLARIYRAIPLNSQFEWSKLIQSKFDGIHHPGCQSPPG